MENKFLKLFTQKKVVFILVIIMCLFISHKTNAATLSVSPSSTTVSIGNIVTIKVLVNTLGKSINNAEAIIQFPTDILEVVSITKSSSIFSLWVEEPSFSNYTGRITFNGGVPNPGFNGQNGNIICITFKAKKQGAASILFLDGAIRENDGLGTDILISKNGGVIKTVIPKETETLINKEENIKKPSTNDDSMLDNVQFSTDSELIKTNTFPEPVPAVTTIMNIFSVAIPVVALIILLAILAVWGWYKVLHYREHLRSKLSHTKSIINKSFDILDEDIEEQIRILKKIKALQPLTNDERTFINQFKKDIEDSEKVIISEVKESEK